MDQYNQDSFFTLAELEDTCLLVHRPLRSTCFIIISLLGVKLNISHHVLGMNLVFVVCC